MTLARISGVDLPGNKRIEVGLTYLYGVGNSSAQKILAQTGVNPNTRVKDLSEEDTAKIRAAIENQFKVEGSLRTEISMNLKRLMDIGSYRGLRHRRGLPVRGQRTRTNARTRKGPKRTVGAAKRKTEAPAKT